MFLLVGCSSEQPAAINDGAPSGSARMETTADVKPEPKKSGGFFSAFTENKEKKSPKRSRKNGDERDDAQGAMAGSKSDGGGFMGGGGIGSLWKTGVGKAQNLFRMAIQAPPEYLYGGLAAVLALIGLGIFMAVRKPTPAL